MEVRNQRPSLLHKFHHKELTTIQLKIHDIDGRLRKLGTITVLIINRSREIQGRNYNDTSRRAAS